MELQRILRPILRSVLRGGDSLVSSGVISDLAIAKFAPPYLTSPFAKFLAASQETDLFTSRLQVAEDDVIVVLGTYEGKSVEQFSRAFPNNLIIGFEPSPTSFRIAHQRVRERSNVILHCVGVAKDERTAHLSADGDASAIVERDILDGSLTELVQLISIDEFFSHYIPRSKGLIIEINIEGGEYEFLEEIIRVNHLSRFRTLFIQFHQIDVTSELRRAQISTLLRESHSRVWCYDWVWERWDRRQPNVDSHDE